MAKATGAVRMWKSWKTVTEMLADRKYYVPESTPVGSPKVFTRDESCDEFLKKLNLDSTIERSPELSKVRLSFQETFAKRKDVDPQLVVVMRESIGNAQVQELDSIMRDLGVTDAIVIYTDKITPSADVAIKHLRVKKINIDCFTEDSLQYNVTRHSYVPKHIICSVETKRNVMEKYHTDKEHIPQIKVTDPVCRYLGAKKGQLIEIVRQSDSIPLVEERKVVGDVETTVITKLYDITYKIVV
jgi:DNA-directed RNA polymerases I, II, and III subunit RPABC1